MTENTGARTPTADRILSRSPFGVFVLGPGGRVRFANATAGSLLDAVGELEGRRFETLLANDQPMAAATAGDATEMSQLSQEAPMDVTLERRDGTQVPVTVLSEPLSQDGKQFRLLWVHERSPAPREASSGTASPIPEWTDGVSSFDDILATTGEFTGASTPRELGKTALRAAERLLGVDVGCVRRYDAETNSFESVVRSEAAAALTERLPAYDLDASVAGRALRRQEVAIERPDTNARNRGSLHVPFADDRVLSLLKPQDGSFFDAEITAARWIARLADIAASRTDPTEVADDRSTDDDPLGRLPTAVTGIVDAVERGDGYRKLGETTCSILVGLDRYDGAWFLDPGIDGTTYELLASAGSAATPIVWDGSAERADGGFLSDVLESDDLGVMTEERSRPDSGAVGSAEKRTDADVVVPLTYSGHSYGILVVRPSTGIDPGEAVKRELRILKRLLGVAMYAAKNRELLYSETVVELEFKVTDPKCTAVRLSEVADCGCRIDHTVRTDEGNTVVFATVKDAPAETVRDAASELEDVLGCEIVERAADRSRLKLVKSESGAEIMTNVGAIVRSATAEAGVGRLVVEAPPSVEVREIIDAYTAFNPDATLVAKRKTEADRHTTPRRLDTELAELLTDRQQSVLMAAYYAGYFDWPRKNTAEEIADSLAISSSTFHRHVRIAERKFLDLIARREDSALEADGAASTALGSSRIE